MEQKSERSWRLERRVWVCYLTTGAALAILRVSLLAWVEYRKSIHSTSETVYNLFWVLRPEVLLGEYTPVGGIPFESLTPHFLFWGSILTVGSFILATPVLLVGWLMQRRQPVG